MSYIFIITPKQKTWALEFRQRQDFDGGLIYKTNRRRLLIAGDGRRSATHQ